MSISLPPVGRPPKDPVEYISWLNQLRLKVEAELEAAYAVGYFNARLAGHLEEVVRISPHSRKKVVAMTRAENERRGRQLKWRDGMDPATSTYARP